MSGAQHGPVDQDTVRKARIQTQDIHQQIAQRMRGTSGMAGYILHLQRTIGNQAVGRLLRQQLGQARAGRSHGPSTTSSNRPVASTSCPSPPIQRQVVDEALVGELTAEEVGFFNGSPSLADAESRLKAMMAGTRGDKPKLTFEIGLIAHDGRVVRANKGEAAKSGANATVKVSKSDIESAVPGGVGEAVVSHNHPGGAPLSKGDVLSAAGLGYKEIRATGKYGEFAVARTEPSWDFIDASELGRSTKITEMYGGAQDGWKAACPPESADWKAPMFPLPDMGGTFADDNFMVKHFACKALAAAYGGKLTYTHPDEATLIEARKNLYQAKGKQSAEMPERTAGGWDSGKATYTAKEKQFGASVTTGFSAGGSAVQIKGRGPGNVGKSKEF